MVPTAHASPCCRLRSFLWLEGVVPVGLCWSSPGCLALLISVSGLALHDVHGEAAHGGFLVFGAHVLAGLAHGHDDLVEGYPVRAVAPERHLGGVDGLCGGDRV